LAGRRIFIDTSYIYALINPNDQWHSAAAEWRYKINTKTDRLITSEFILAEVADGLASLAFRKAASVAIRLLQSDQSVEIHPASSNLFERAMDLFESRADKDWGLTDCTSFVVMRDFDLMDALTTDGHFQQAGFNPLLRV